MNKRELTAAVEDLQAWRRSMEVAPIKLVDFCPSIFGEPAPALTAAARLREIAEGRCGTKYMRWADAFLALANVPPADWLGVTADHHNAGIIAAQEAALSAVEGKDGQ
jgi:hypothetical protein